ncbi:MAG: pilus assembly protein PilP [Desulfatirhabdiaceae bacterium]
MRGRTSGLSFVVIIAMAVWCLMVTGCQEQEKPISQPEIIRVKIADASRRKIPQQPIPIEKQKIDSSGKSTSAQIPTPGVAAIENEGPEVKTSPHAVATSDGTVMLDPDAQPMLPDIQKLTYRPEGKIDPFAPLFKDETVAPVVEKSVRKKRLPQTPLENLDLSQLKLTAIYKTSKGFRALVEESSGKGYVIDVGTYIGRNSGKVIAIQQETVRIEEEIEDALGKVHVESRELKLLKPTGEL